VVIAIVSVSVLVLIGAVVVAVAKDPGPGPEDVAIAYERAWDRLDFDTLYTLAGRELRDGLERSQYIAAKHAAYAQQRVADRPGRSGQGRRQRHSWQRPVCRTQVELPGIVLNRVDSRAAAVAGRSWVTASRRAAPGTAPGAPAPG
jgi:hypothetical protein